MSQNVQFGISKFPGIWTLALSDIVPLKIEHQYLKIKRFPIPFLFSAVTETTFSDVTARQEDQPCGVRVSSHTGMVNQ